LGAKKKIVARSKNTGVNQMFSTSTKKIFPQGNFLNKISSQETPSNPVPKKWVNCGKENPWELPKKYCA